MKRFTRLNVYRALAVVLFFFMTITTIRLLGQNDPRLDRDVKVMQQALQEVFNDEYGRSGNYFNLRTKNAGKYVPGFGIMLNAPGKMSGRVRVIGHGQNGLSSTESPRDEQEENESQIVSIIQHFIHDYGDLARELPEDESIMVRYKDNQDGGFAYIVDDQYNNRRRYSQSISIGGTYPGEERKSGEISVKVKKKDIEAYKSGKIDRDEFYDRMETSIVSTNLKGASDYRVFSGILKGLYSSNEPSNIVLWEGQSRNREEIEKEQMDSFFKQNSFAHKSSFGESVPFEVIRGYGVIYTLKLGYPLKGYNGGVAILLDRFEREREGEEADLEKEQIDYLRKRDDKIEEIYDDFLSELKGSMIEYGRTLKSLESGEFLNLSVEMPACYECELPAEIEMKVSQEKLAAYDQRKISLEEAMKNIKVDLKGKASELRDLPAMMNGNERRSLPGRSVIIKNGRLEKEER